MKDFSSHMKNSLKKFENESSSYISQMLNAIKTLEESNSIIDANLKDMNEYIIELGKTTHKFQEQKNYNQALIENYKKIINYDEIPSQEVKKER